MWKQADKYIAVLRMTLLQQLAYIYDFFIRTIFLILILFIFSKLWLATYEVNGSAIIEGYSLQKMMWYLVITESIYMALPVIVDRIEKEVKNGEIAYFLNRPISYVGFQYGQYLGEAILRMFINIAVGTVLMFVLVGRIEFGFTSFIGFVLLSVLAISLNFVTVMCVCLSSFWVEDIRGFFLIYQRLLMILGGMMVPLEIFPEWLEGLARILPFHTIINIPASYFVGTNQQGFLQLFIQQSIWLTLFTLVLIGVYKLGVRRLHVNGG